MEARELRTALGQFSPSKHVVTMQAHMDPFYYDSSDTEANSIIIVTDDEGCIFEIIETDSLNNVTRKVEILGGWKNEGGV